MRTGFRPILFGCVVAIAMWGLLPLEAQQAPDPDVPLSFEAASVKPNKAGEGGEFVRRQPGGRFTATNMPLRQLIRFAYQVQPTQLIGGPGWIASDRFDIVAKMEGEA